MHRRKRIHQRMGVVVGGGGSCRLMLFGESGDLTSVKFEQIWGGGTVGAFELPSAANSVGRWECGRITACPTRFRSRPTAGRAASPDFPSGVSDH